MCAYVCVHVCILCACVLHAYTLCCVTCVSVHGMCAGCVCVCACVHTCALCACVCLIRVQCVGMHPCVCSCVDACHMCAHTDCSGPMTLGPWEPLGGIGDALTTAAGQPQARRPVSQHPECPEQETPKDRAPPRGCRVLALAGRARQKEPDPRACAAWTAPARSPRQALPPHQAWTPSLRPGPGPEGGPMSLRSAPCLLITVPSPTSL